MTDPNERIARAGASLEATLTAQEREALRERIIEGAQRHRRRRRAALAVAACALLVGLGALASSLSSAPPEATLPAGTIALADGSRVQPDPGADVHVTSVSADAIQVALEGGRARFVVSKRPERAFEVRAGEVTVRVLGTTFDVERRADRVSVRVEEGRVQVLGPHGELVLTQGEHADVPDARLAVKATTPDPDDAPSPEPPPADPPSPEVAPEDPPSPRDRPPSAPREATRRADAAPDWRAYAQQGDYVNASRALAPPGKLRRVEDLMDAAEVMRLAGADAEALPYLERVGADFAGDPRAPLAEFTRARLLLRKLGRPTQAARVFAAIHARHPRSSFAERALASEVEAWAKAGDPTRAISAARAYQARYPGGAHLDAVRLYADLP
jgi:hypothetical protein